MTDDFTTIETKKCLNVKVDKVLKWAYERNIIKGSTYKDQYLKAQSEMGELADALLKGQKDDVEDAIGDVLVCLINLAEQCDTTVYWCLETAYNSIKDRNGVMFNGAFVKESDPNYERIVKHVKAESVQTDLFSKE